MQRHARAPNRRLSRLCAACVLASAPAASAGMPMVGLSHVASLRLEVISFFLVLLLLVTLAVQRLWNELRADFPALPKLSFRRALTLVLIWGFAFNLVLTMISGTRELMTPGAWERDGDEVTYRLRSEPERHD